MISTTVWFWPKSALDWFRAPLTRIGEKEMNILAKTPPAMAPGALARNERLGPERGVARG